MNIAYLCPSISRSYGGIFEIERRLAQELQEIPETEISVFGINDEHTEVDIPAWLPVIPKHFPYYGPRAFRYSPGLRRAFDSCDADVAHLHSMWLYTSVVVQDWGRRKNRPYLTTINGMLDPWALNHSSWKKRISGYLYERAALDGASTIQVNSMAELRFARAYGLRNPICIIPNGVDLPSSLPATNKTENRAGRSSLLYLGRIHPKKGLANLLRAWAHLLKTDKLASRDWQMIVAGWDQGGHENDLKRLATELAIPWSAGTPCEDVSLVFPGPLFDKGKAAAFAACSSFILPSFSEGLPMAVLEAWAYGKPVVMTPECNLPDGFSKRAALRIDPQPDAIESGLRELIGMSQAEREQMGQNGRSLVAGSYSWPVVAAELRAVYAWMLGGGERPASICSE